MGTVPLLAKHPDEVLDYVNWTLVKGPLVMATLGFIVGYVVRDNKEK